MEELLEEMKSRSTHSTTGLEDRITKLQEQERQLDQDIVMERERVAELRR
jgi:hypothetical protein